LQLSNDKKNYEIINIFSGMIILAGNCDEFQKTNLLIDSPGDLENIERAPILGNLRGSGRADI
jgi:hypothetical protein